MENTYVEMKKSNEKFKHFKLFCALAWEHCNDYNDFIFLINGKRGTGKSTFGVAFLQHYLPTYLGVPFNKKTLRAHMVSDVDLLNDRVHSLPNKHPIIVDEGVLAAYVGDFAKKNVKDLFKLFTVCRTKNRPVGLVSPEFSDLMSRLRNYAIYRVRLIKRGMAALFARDDSEGAGVDPFHMKRLKDLEGYYDVNTPAELIIRKLRKHPCFKDIISVPRLGNKAQAWYDKYRDEMVFAEAHDQSRIIDRIAMIYHNLEINWADWRAKKKLMKTDFVRNACFNPVDNKAWWKRSNHLGEAHQKLKDDLAKKEAQKSLNNPLT